MADSTTLKRVEAGSEIAISFEMAFTDGEVIEVATADAPMQFVIGDGSILPRLEELLIGLEEGTQGKFTLSPEAAFGMKSAENIQTMQKEDFPEGMALEKGLVIGFQTPTGDEIPGTILSVGENAIDVDFNHPLAGATLLFTVKVEKVFS